MNLLGSSNPLPIGQPIDPLKFVNTLWPHITLYDKQRQIMYSVAENDETFVPAGNALGKDFVGGLTVLYFFLSRHPCRVVTTSVDATQLNAVLWGEIRRFLQTSVYPLTTLQGGNILVNDLHLRKVVNGEVCGLSYVLGRVANMTGEGMLGHHIAKTGDGIKRTLAVADEASGVPHVYYEKFDTWADSKLVIGNPFPCSNFFKRAVKGDPVTGDKGGDILRPSGDGYYRRVIRIKAEDSPNVKLGLQQKAAGRVPTNRMLIDGVKDYATYEKNRALWDKIRQTISLDADFYEGSENLMFPPDWLNTAERWAVTNRRWPAAEPRALGVDPAEGGDSSTWSAVNRLGLYKQWSRKTPDTSFIPKFTLSIMAELDIPAENVWFDSGGGGKQAADTLRDRGHKVKTVAFGEAASDTDRFKRYRSINSKVLEYEDKAVYKNRRAEMYHILRKLLDPVFGGWGLPAEYVELRRQLAPMPLLLDAEGKYRMLPKNRTNAQSKEQTLSELLGCSPDEADSLVLAVFGLMDAATPKRIIGALL